MTNSVDNQRGNNGRDAKGRFTRGNASGFQAGQSGNVGGRPKSLTLSEALRQQLAEKMPGADERTYREEIARVLCDEAVKGNIAAIREIFDRLEGKPKMAVDVSATIHDWREMARAHGLTEAQVVAEARRLIDSDSDSSDA